MGESNTYWRYFHSGFFSDASRQICNPEYDLHLWCKFCKCRQTVLWKYPYYCCPLKHEIIFIVTLHVSIQLDNYQL